MKEIWFSRNSYSIEGNRNSIEFIFYKFGYGIQNFRKHGPASIGKDCFLWKEIFFNHDYYFGRLEGPHGLIGLNYHFHLKNSNSVSEEEYWNE